RCAPRRDGEGDGTLLRGGRQRGPEHPRLPRLRLHVPERATRASLWDRGGQGGPVPPREAPGRPARGSPDAGEHPDDHLEPDAALAREAGEVDPRAGPRLAPAAPPAGRPRPEGEPGWPAEGLAPAADGAAPRQYPLRLVPREDGPARLR